jgi:site-specific DNA-methyltransferase (adenine-specific)
MRLDVKKRSEGAPAGAGAARAPGRRRQAPADATHLLAHADVLDLLAALPPRLRFDLIYLDPPYGGGGVMNARDAIGQGRGRRAAGGGRAAYDDATGGVEALLAMLVPRLAALRERMSPSATLWLHLDHRAVHEAKVAADAVFGRGAFVGEVVWTPGNGGRGARGFAVTHQTLLLYARGAAERRSVLWRADDPLLREPYAATSQRMHFTRRDDDGRLFRERVIAGKAYRYYADQGRRIGSVWTDIPAMTANTPLHSEGTGYPTQKPERLLERIVRASSEEGGTVCDPMCGSGTALAVAARLGRRFVGGDRSAVAIEVTRRRLDAAGVRYRFR